MAVASSGWWYSWQPQRNQSAPARLYEEGGWANLPSATRALSDSGNDGFHRVRDVLQKKGYDVMYHETGGAHEGVHWGATLAEGLIALFGQPTK